MKITITKGDNPVGRLFAETPSIESEAEYRKLMIVEELLTLMAEKGISRGELAKRMEVQPSRITAMMTGSNNFTIETLVRAGRAVGAELAVHFVPVKDVAVGGSGKPRAVPRATSKVAEGTKAYRAKRKNEKA
jgi:predicted XRE-type DNA-binding protein